MYLKRYIYIIDYSKKRKPKERGDVYKARENRYPLFSDILYSMRGGAYLGLSRGVKPAGCQSYGCNLAYFLGYGRSFIAV